MRKEVLRLDRVTQVIDNIIYLDNFNFYIFKSEIVGIIGKNFNGLSEFLNIAVQNIPISQGYIYFEDILVNQYQFSSMSFNKTYIIEKKCKLVEDLTVIDNIFILKKNLKMYIINKEILKNQFEQFIKDLDFELNGNLLVSSLSFFEKCVVELIKAVLTGSKLIIIKDLPNIMSPFDLLNFNRIIKYYKKQGISFIYVFNHHEDSFNICDRVCLMENGRILKVLTKEQFTDEILDNYISDFFKDKNKCLTKKHQMDGILSFKNVSLNKIKDFNFTIEKGECTVFLDSSGTIINDFKNLLIGKTISEKGEILINSESINNKYNFLKYISIIDETPTDTMLFKSMSYLDNLCFLINDKIKTPFFSKKIKKGILHEYKDIIGDYIYSQNLYHLPLDTLYNLIYYRVYLYKPKIAICINPFAEADMYLRKKIIKLIQKLIGEKITIIIITLNISDSLLIADKVFIIEKGTITKGYTKDSFDYFKGKNRTKNMLNLD